MRIFLTLGAAAALATAGSAQNALSESFDFSTSGVFPPAGWMISDAGTAPVIWEESGLTPNFQTIGTLLADAAFHSYTGQGVQAESNLDTPKMDLSNYGMPELTFDSDVFWTLYMAHHPSTLANGVSTVEVSTDGGMTWSVVWTESAIVDGFTPAINVDLASVANQMSVIVRFHYSGEFAQEWAVDNVSVDNAAPAGMVLSQLGTCGQVGSGLAVTGASANALVGFAWSQNTGPFVIGGAACVGTTVDLINPKPIATASADAMGNAALIPGMGIPAQGCNVITCQAIDLNTCMTSNTLPI